MDRLMDRIHTSVRNQRNLLESALDYVYKNCAGYCGLKGFMAKFIVYAIVNYCNANIGGWEIDMSTEGLRKLTPDNEELYQAVFELLRDTNGEIQQSPEQVSARGARCQWQ